MKLKTADAAGTLLVALSLLFQPGTGPTPASAQSPPAAAAIALPAPVLDGPVSLEKALQERRSVRTYRGAPLTMADISQILWAAQGVTDPRRGLRTAPSAKATFPLQIYLLASRVTDLPMGLYQYQPQGHRIVQRSDGDKKKELYAAVGQAPIKTAPAVIVLTGLTDRGSTPRTIFLEGGHAAQNIYLQAQALNLGTVAMGGFRDQDVRRVLGLPEGEQPVYIMPLGRR